MFRIPTGMIFKIPNPQLFFLFQKWCCFGKFWCSIELFFFPILSNIQDSWEFSCCWGFSLWNFLVLTLTHVLNICMKKRDLSDIFWLQLNTPIPHLSSTVKYNNQWPCTEYSLALITFKNSKFISSTMLKNYSSVPFEFFKF